LSRVSRREIIGFRCIDRVNPEAYVAGGFAPPDSGDLAGIVLMCSFPDEISACLPELRKADSGPIGACGHIGYNDNPKCGSSPDEPYFSIDIGEYTPERYAEIASDWKKMGRRSLAAAGPPRRSTSRHCPRRSDARRACTVLAGAGFGGRHSRDLRRYPCIYSAN